MNDIIVFAQQHWRDALVVSSGLLLAAFAISLLITAVTFYFYAIIELINSLNKKKWLTDYCALTL